MNLGESRDQAQIQAEGCDPLNRPKDRQGGFPQAIGTSIAQINRATRY